MIRDSHINGDDTLNYIEDFGNYTTTDNVRMVYPEKNGMYMLFNISDDDLQVTFEFFDDMMFTLKKSKSVSVVFRNNKWYIFE